jgi:hypothetical protein
MSRWQSTLYDTVLESKGVKYIKLETDRLVWFQDALSEAESGRNKLWRWAARVSKLAEGDYQVKQWECLIDDLETFVAVHRTELVKRRGGEKVKQRIKLLEMVTIENGATKGEQENARRAIETLREKTT